MAYDYDDYIKVAKDNNISVIYFPHIIVKSELWLGRLAKANISIVYTQPFSNYLTYLGREIPPKIVKTRFKLPKLTEEDLLL